MRRLLLLLVIAGAAAQAQNLPEVKRICVETLNGGETAANIRDMIIAALQKTGAFTITENRQSADAVLKGSAEDMVFTETFQSHEGITARLGAGGTTKSGRSPGLSIGEQESERSTERKHEAFATVRLVNKDGDVIWSTTQESLGAKFRGASADVADKVARQLMADVDKAKTRPPLKP